MYGCLATVSRSDQESAYLNVQLAVEPMHHSVRQSLQVDFLHHQTLVFIK